MSDDPTEQAKNAVAVLATLAETAQSNPDMKNAAKSLARSVNHLATTIEVCLLPFAAISFTYQKAKNYFNEKFAEDLTEVIGEVPQEQIIEPQASIAAPLLQNLAYAVDQASLKKMYLTLLGNSMRKDKQDNVHPAFIDAIRQLSGDEAHLLPVFLRASQGIALAEIRLTEAKRTNFTVLDTHIAAIYEAPKQTPAQIPNLPLYIDNWQRLGLVSVSYDTWFSHPSSYDWVEERPEFRREIDKYKLNPDKKVKFQKGLIKPTSFGLAFAGAVL